MVLDVTVIYKTFNGIHVAFLKKNSSLYIIISLFLDTPQPGASQKLPQVRMVSLP
jgi:hypothetical protein